MRVFLTGATGYIGGAVTDVLRAGGHELTGLARSEPPAARLSAAGIRPVRGDFIRAIQRGRRRPRGRRRHQPGQYATMRPSTAPRSTPSSMPSPAATSRSSIPAASGPMAIPVATVVDETSPVHPAPLVAWRQAVEERVREGAKRGIRSVVFRPASGLRPGRRYSRRVRRLRTEEWRRAVRGHRPEPLAAGPRGRPGRSVRDRARPGSRRDAAPGRAPPVACAVRDLAAAASRGAGAGGRTVAWPLEEARQKLGAYADALVLDQQASGRRAGGARLASASPRRARGSRARLVREARRVTA